MSAKGEDLAGQLSKTDSFCLGAHPDHDYTHLFCGDHTLFLKSDTDEQLIVNMAYMQTMKVTSLSLGLPADESCPKTLKIFVNKVNFGFEECSDEAPTLVLNLEQPEAPTSLVVNLPAAKFNRIDSRKFQVDFLDALITPVDFTLF